MDERYRIRRATVADAAVLAGIERECFADPWSLAGITEMVQFETMFAFVAENEADAAGYVMARITGEEGEILNLAVLPTMRGVGLGRGLLETALTALSNAGAREAYLEVRESNAQAIALYRAHGFRPVGLRPHYYRSPPEDALVLRVDLVPVQY
jgi:ribosomal-protein-alanine N-acetyltransferase